MHRPLKPVCNLRQFSCKRRSAPSLLQAPKTNSRSTRQAQPRNVQSQVSKRDTPHHQQVAKPNIKSSHQVTNRAEQTPHLRQVRKKATTSSRPQQFPKKTVRSTSARQVSKKKPQPPRKIPDPLSRTTSCSTVATTTSGCQKNGKVLGQLLRKQMWTAVNVYLSVDGTTGLSKKLIASSMKDDPSQDSENALHIACQHNPPLSIVRQIVSIFPGCAEELNHRGQTALHVAVMFDATADVIKFLVEQYPYAVSIGDELGETPLHMACKRSSINRRSFSLVDHCEGKVRHALYHKDVMLPLCLVAPGSVFSEKLNGESILEYAIEEGADLETVLMIQEATARAERPKARLKRSMCSSCA